MAKCLQAPAAPAVPIPHGSMADHIPTSPGLQKHGRASVPQGPLSRCRMTDGRLSASFLSSIQVIKSSGCASSCRNQYLTSIREAKSRDDCSPGFSGAKLRGSGRMLAPDDLRGPFLSMLLCAAEGGAPKTSSTCQSRCQDSHHDSVIFICQASCHFNFTPTL